MLKTIITPASTSAAVDSGWIEHPGGPLSLQLIAEGDDLDGDWAIFKSNKPGVRAVGDDYPADITWGFAPVKDDTASISAVDHTEDEEAEDSTNTQRQYVQSSFVAAGAIKVVFTPSAGTGVVGVHAGLEE
jgi:hypothetical protein